jgi:hypothetical protein
MDDLVQWLRAQLGEDERIARACSGDGRWDAGDIAIYGKDLGVEVRDHMAEHDPARVLREIEATRRLIRAHEKWCEGRCEAKYPEGGFDAAHYWNIKLRAEVYADRPGYLGSWRP